MYSPEKPYQPWWAEPDPQSSYDVDVVVACLPLILAILDVTITFGIIALLELRLTSLVDGQTEDSGHEICYVPWPMLSTH